MNAPRKPHSDALPPRLRDDIGRVDTKPRFDPLKSLVNDYHRVVYSTEESLIRVDLGGAARVSLRLGDGELHLSVEPFAESHDTSPVRSSSGAGNTPVSAGIVQETTDMPSPGVGAVRRPPSSSHSESSEVTP